jgi:tetratricopeptide (TPR) repeat protein
LRQSKCFQKSEMTCVTCHHPHRPQQSATVRAACLKCHTADSCPEQPRLPVAVRGDCAGCHMPARVWMNVRFHTADDQYVPVAPRFDHRIAVYPEAKQAVLLAWLRGQTDAPRRAEADRLASLLARHWLDEAERRRRDSRLLATIGALREAMKADPRPATRRRLDEAITRQAEFDRLVTATNAPGQRPPGETAELMKKILEIKPDYAPAHGELGTAYALMGKRPEADSHLRAAQLYDPEDTYCRVSMAQLAYLDGRWAEAEALYAKADEIEPYDANIHNGWGLALLKQERLADAAAHFRRALTIDPRHAGGSDGLSEVLRRQGQVEEALLHARRAVRWSHSQNAKMLLTLADAYTAAHRPADARKALERALTAAEASNSGLVPTIRARLDKSR